MIDWRRSAKGNLWRRLDDDGVALTLTIFRDRDSYGWCISGPSGPSFSESRFATEQDAMENLMAALAES